jgi:photosystem II stability/assembly factor-like uncharacterized protein
METRLIIVEIKSVARSHTIVFRNAIIWVIVVWNLACKENVLVVEKPEPPAPPVQIGVWDSVGLRGVSNISSIRVVANQPWIIYAGVQSNFSDGTTGEILKSSDWGAHWVVSAESISVACISIASGVDGIIYAGLNANNGAIPGILKTTNGGMTWARADSGVYLSSEGWVDILEIDPIDPNVVYAGIVGFFGGGLIKTSNGGESWTLVPTHWTGTIPPLGGGVSTVAIDPRNTNEVYAGIAETGALFKSYDGGQTFNALADSGASIPVSLVINPFRSNMVYHGEIGAGFYRSTDHGETWSRVPSPIASGHSIMVYKDSVLFVSDYYGNFGGVYRSNDDGSSWKDISLKTQGFPDPIVAMDLDRRNRFIYVADGKVASAGIYRYHIPD